MKQTIKQPKIFYGWYILSIGVVGAFLAAGSSQLFMSIMLKPLTEEFGWSRTAATGAITTGTIIAGLLSLPFGRLADRYGPRLLSSIGAVVTAGVYVALTKFTNLWQFYVVFVIGRAISSNTLASIAPQTAAVNWFRRFRGRALGLIAMATPLGSSLLAIIAQLIMVNHGWRTVFVVLAFAMIFLQAIPAPLVLRRRPEDLGLVPDGNHRACETPPSSEQTPVEAEFGWSLSEAIRTLTLWLIITSIVIALTVNAGVGFHLVAYYTDAGIDATVAVGAMSLYAFTGALASLIWGFLTEKFSERLLASGVLLLSAGANLYLLLGTTITGAFIFAVLFGFTSRGEGTLINIILAQYYGRSSYGAISGFVYPFYMLALGFGPLISSLSFDLTGSYHAVFSFFIAVSIIASFLIWLAKKPTPPVRKSSSLSPLKNIRS